MDETIASGEERYVKLSLFILFGITSIISIILILYHFIKIQSFHRQFHHQTLIILICMVFFNIMFNIPTLLCFYARGYVIQKSRTFCMAWQFIDYTFTCSIIWCQAIFTIERYVIVFHPNLYRTQEKRFIFHYIPLISMNLYLTLFFPLVSLLPYCKDKYEANYVDYLCGYQCLDRFSGVAVFNMMFNILFPTFIIIFVSITLLVRVLWARRIMQRNLRNWSKNWKMIIQLLGISIIYITVWLPLSIINLFDLFGPDSDTAHKIANQFYFLTYLCEMAVPIIALLFWPEIIQNLRRRVRAITVASVKTGPC